MPVLHFSASILDGMNAQFSLLHWCCKVGEIISPAFTHFVNPSKEICCKELVVEVLWSVHVCVCVCVCVCT